nr:DUF1330 domain-containing protein [Dickeya dianthicola]
MISPCPFLFIINVAIHHPEGMKPYQEKVAETYPPYGGKLLVLGGKARTSLANSSAPLSIVSIRR